MSESAIESATISAPSGSNEPSVHLESAPPPAQSGPSVQPSLLAASGGPLPASLVAPVLGPPCQIENVLPKVATNIRELVENMNKFTATEDLVRERVDLDGKHHLRERSQSNYVVTLQNVGTENFTVSEFRNQVRGDHHMEGGLATSGGPSLALVFHPSHLEEFDMTCGNLVKIGGRAAWEIRFRQRKDRPAQITTFLDGHTQFSILLDGIAWIDAAKYQLLRIDTSLLQPIPEAKLELLDQSVEYAPVAFTARDTTLWLPRSVDVTAKFRGTRYHDQHTLSDFKLFAIDTGQKINTPKQTPPPSEEKQPEESTPIVPTSSAPSALGHVGWTGDPH